MQNMRQSSAEDEDDIGLDQDEDVFNRNAEDEEEDDDEDAVIGGGGGSVTDSAGTTTRSQTAGGGAAASGATMSIRNNGGKAVEIWLELIFLGVVTLFWFLLSLSSGSYFK